ncbi:unnamed protein product [Caenorhabditis auriculariae]|uniref:Uncharacterized protein n=1 Tax=Caenorhabditis auriculariae TaxID=2777116 RepID=A0A8S1H1E2_9PELO|nr:unnamed protein product [Caenorhabditis auriculariae]
MNEFLGVFSMSFFFFCYCCFCCGGLCCKWLFWDVPQTWRPFFGRVASYCMYKTWCGKQCFDPQEDTEDIVIVTRKESRRDFHPEEPLTPLETHQVSFGTSN